jgi:hypothetical protein
MVNVFRLKVVKGTGFSKQGNHYMISWLFDGENWHVTKYGCPGNEANNGKKD